MISAAALEMAFHSKIEWGIVTNNQLKRPVPLRVSNSAPVVCTIGLLHYLSATTMKNVESIVAPAQSIHSVALVVPVYRGEMSIRNLVEEVIPLTTCSLTKLGHLMRIDEIVLVSDCGPDASGDVIRQIVEQFTAVRSVWLSRNFGQHAATVAGIAATSSDWVVTLDEDGQHDPHHIPDMLDCAIQSRASLVYARPIDGTSHGIIRDVASTTAKRFVSILSGTKGPLLYSSFRLMLGEIGRSVAAYAGPSVYLDVALSWITQDVASLKVDFRTENRKDSGYSTKKLMSHFWKLVVSTGVRPLRLVSLAGATAGVVGVALAIKVIVDRLLHGVVAQGWASVIIGILIFGGAILLSIGVIAEYLGFVVKSSMGQPTYLTVRDPKNTPRYGRGTGSGNN